MADSGRPAASLSPVPRWMADEMLGRLARYLRFLGHDTVYVRGLADAEIRDRAVREGRVLLTRDRELARATPGALLLESPEIRGQVEAVRRAYPAVPFEVRFDRCSLCNEPLRHWVPPADDSDWPPEVPRERVQEGLVVYECPGCGQRYWDGSHTRRIRQQLKDWFP